jgi:hypothetical protein
MKPVNLLVLIHGMTTESTRLSHKQEYDTLYEGIVKARGSLKNDLAGQIRVEWGHRTGPAPAVRPDERIADAEVFLHDRIAYRNVLADKDSGNHTLSFPNEIFSKLVTRFVTDPIKEKVLLFGVTDVFYYCSADGESAVRRAVYGQVLQQLEAYRESTEVRLHVVAHSLGVTVSHDFLYGLFAPDNAWSDGTPDYLKDPDVREEDKVLYAYWRGRAQANPRTLQSASFSTSAGQLPLMMMRKQSLVDRLARNETLNPSVIGIPAGGSPKWKMFYDVDDVLAFPARRLYEPTTAIEEYQVDTGWRPDLNHSLYWSNDYVLTQTADLIHSNLR